MKKQFFPKSCVIGCRWTNRKPTEEIVDHLSKLIEVVVFDFLVPAETTASFFALSSMIILGSDDAQVISFASARLNSASTSMRFSQFHLESRPKHR